MCAWPYLLSAAKIMGEENNELSLKVNRNFSPQRNVSTQATSESILLKENAPTMSPKLLRRRDVGEKPLIYTWSRVCIGAHSRPRRPRECRGLVAGLPASRGGHRTAEVLTRRCGRTRLRVGSVQSPARRQREPDREPRAEPTSVDSRGTATCGTDFLHYV